MKTNIFPPGGANVWLAGLCVLTIASGVARAAEEEEDWLRHLRVGGVVALNVKAKFTMSGQFAVAGNPPGAAGTGGTHFYDDGYVRPDQGTDPNYTSFWGYNSASQFDPGAQTLTFHSTKSFNLNGGSADETSVQVGLDLAYGEDLGRWAKGWYGWEVGFGFLPIKITDNQKLSGSFVRTIHRFDTGGIVMPEAPYNGGDSGLGPNLPNTATALPDDSTAGTITGSRTLDVSLYSLRLGPTMHWRPHPRWAVTVSGGPAVGYAEGEYKFKETITLADGSRSRNSGSYDNSKIVFGGYVGGTLLFHTAEQVDVYVGAQFMSLSSMSVSGGGRKAELDLAGGVYLSAGLSWPF